MGIKLIQFFDGDRDPIGLRFRPAWHRKQVDEQSWTFVPPDESDKIRYWFKNYDNANLKYWPGFAFALSPEYYKDYKEIDKQNIEKICSDILKKHSDLKIIIAVGWVGLYHFPFILTQYSDDFKNTTFRSLLTKLLEPSLLK